MEQRHYLQTPLALPRAQLIRVMRVMHRSDLLTTLTSKRGASEEQTKPMIFKLRPAGYQLAINKSLACTRQGHMIAFLLH